MSAAFGMLIYAGDGDGFADWVGWGLAGGVLVAAGALVNRVWAAVLPLAFAVCLGPRHGADRGLRP